MMNQEVQPRVGFFRGIAAVLRATVHAFGVALGLLGRGVAALTRRSRGAATDAGDGE